MMQKVCKRCGKVKNMYSWENFCYNCQKEIDKEAIQKAIRSGEKVDTTSDKYVYCPYCGHALETNLGYEDFPEIYDEGCHDLTCPECDRDFILNTWIFRSYDTRKKGR